MKLKSLINDKLIEMVLSLLEGLKPFFLLMRRAISRNGYSHHCMT